MAQKYTRVPSDTFEKLQLNAGILVDDFTPSTGVIGNILGATTGGINFTTNPEFTDFGEDIDNMPNNMMEMMHLKQFAPQMAGTFLTCSPSLAKKLVANKLQNPFKRIAFVGIGISLLLLLFWQGRYAGLGTNLIDICFAGQQAADVNAAGAAGIFACDWILKFALTIATIAVGFKGGEVTPLFAIGATFGAWIAAMVGVPLPLAAALGYAAVFGGATNTLFAPIFIGAEIFGFDTLPAFFIVCVLAFACNGGQSIYPQKKLRIK